MRSYQNNNERGKVERSEQTKRMRLTLFKTLSNSISHQDKMKRGERG